MNGVGAVHHQGQLVMSRDRV